MHSSDRTMLASFGFADVDKKISRHDWACQYLAQIEVLTTFFKNRLPEEIQAWSEYKFATTLEHHITKGEGKYKTTIGFADVIFEGEIVTRWPIEKTCPGLVQSLASVCSRCGTPLGSAYRVGDQYFCDSCYRKQHLPLEVPKAVELWPVTEHVRTQLKCGLIEVKITPVAVGDILRQVKLYREWFPVNCYSNSSDRLRCQAQGGADYVPQVQQPPQFFQPRFAPPQFQAQFVVAPPQQFPAPLAVQSLDVPMVVCVGEKCPARESTAAKTVVIDSHAAAMSCFALVVTDWALDALDVAALAKDGIFHAQLGADFEAFLQQRSAMKPVANSKI